MNDNSDDFLSDRAKLCELLATGQLKIPEGWKPDQQQQLGKDFSVLVVAIYDHNFWQFVTLLWQQKIWVRYLLIMDVWQRDVNTQGYCFTWWFSFIFLNSKSMWTHNSAWAIDFDALQSLSMVTNRKWTWKQYHDWMGLRCFCSFFFHWRPFQAVRLLCVTCVLHNVLQSRNTCYLFWLIWSFFHL